MAQGSIIKVKGKRGATWAIRFYGPDGKRHYKTIGPSKGDAQRALRGIMGKGGASWRGNGWNWWAGECGRRP